MTTPNSAFSDPVSSGPDHAMPVMGARRVPGFALVGWTLFLWASRLRLVLDNDQLDSWGTAWRVGVVVLFTALALIVGYAMVRHARWERTAATVLIWWTVAFWLVRGTAIIIDDHTLGFIVIHAILMAVSIGAALWVWRTRRDLPPMWVDGVVVD